LKEGKLSDSKPYKTNDDFPIGHGEKSVIMIQPLIELTPQEVGIIRWHMGPYDPAWTDVRDKVIKKWPEALLFHHIDEEVSQFYGL
jgi:hypothetical protein